MPDGEITEQHGTPALKLKFATSDTRHKILFLGDLHWDHPRCDRTTLKRILDDALAQNAWIVLVGDTFCLMQGKNDRRSNKDDIRPEHNTEDYFGAVIDTAKQWFEPYARNMWIVLEGNHESSAKRNHEFDVTRAFVTALNDKTGSKIIYPGYSTYALIRTETHGTRRETKTLWLAHGHGGGGEVTKGTIQAQRRAVMFPDAEYLVSGHIHSDYYVAHDQWRITKEGKAYAMKQRHYVVNTFKEEFKKGKGGYHVERGRGPKIPSGWMSEWFNRSDKIHGRWFEAY